MAERRVHPNPRSGEAMWCSRCSGYVKGGKCKCDHAEDELRAERDRAVEEREEANEAEIRQAREAAKQRALASRYEGGLQGIAQTVYGHEWETPLAELICDTFDAHGLHWDGAHLVSLAEQTEDVRPDDAPPGETIQPGDTRYFRPAEQTEEAELAERTAGEALESAAVSLNYFRDAPPQDKPHDQRLIEALHWIAAEVRASRLSER